MKSDIKNGDYSRSFTPGQIEAINHDCARDGSVIISAAAGSGKTSVLTEHVINLICDADKKIRADRIAVVTFTKKAAAEIRERLEKALLLRITNVKGNKNTEYLNNQLIRLDEAYISTISAFCLDIIREYASEAGLSPGFRNLDETEADEFMSRALENTLERLYDVNIFTTEERTCLDALTGEIGDEALSVILRGFHETAVKQVNPDAWLESIPTVYKNADNSLTERFLPAAVKVMNDKAELFLKLCNEGIKTAFGTKMQKNLEDDRRVAEEWKKWILSLLKRDLNEAKAELNGLLACGFSRASYGKDFNESDLLMLKDNRSKCKKLALELGEWSKLIFTAEGICKALFPSVEVLIKLYRLLAYEYSSLKLAANAVDFEDMERMCLELLKKDKGKYAEEIGGRLHEIIVDEFQDSNGLQYAVFTALKGGQGLYLVGDIKQSIYRFRNADPRVFNKVLCDSAFKKLYLNRNFRSDKEVVEAVNGVFNGLMTSELGGIDYDENARLICGKAALPESLSDKMTSELCIIRYSAAEIISGETDEPVGVKRLEAHYIAKRIKEMTSGGFLIPDENNNGVRPCRYGDIAVIVSALKTVEADFLEAFALENIPVERNGGGDYLSLGEVGLALNLLKIIDNPHSDDTALVSVLLSPLYGMEINDVALIKAYDIINAKKKGSYNKNVYKQDLFDCLGSYSSDGANANTDAYEKAKRFLKDITRFRAFSENNPPSRLIRNIYDEGVFLPLIAEAEKLYDAEKITANLRLLLYYADNLSGFTGLDIKHLSGFVGFLKDKLNNGKKLSEADVSSEKSADNGRVKLLTVHASKGLEFPVCFVARLNSSFNNSEIKSDVIFDDEGISARYIDPVSLQRYDSLLHRLAKNRITEELRSEEMRKLYVAMTRAEYKLVMTGAAAVDEKSGELRIKPDSHLNWVFNSNAVKTGALKCMIIEDSELFKISDYRGAADVKSEISAIYADENEKASIRKALNTVYNRKELTFIPKKLTATQIGVESGSYTEAENDEPSVFPRYPSFLKEKKLTGKKRGDCYHKLMKLLSFEAGNYREQIKSLEERFTKEEYKAIDIEQILAFFEGGLGKRAVKSQRILKEFPLYTEISFSELFGHFSPNDTKPDGNQLDKKFSERPFIQGVADMFFYENGEIVLLDYKTNRRPTADGLKKEYRNQLLIYKKAIEEMTGAAVKECWIYSFEIGEIFIM